jgi:predicted Zn-dependent peptidase
MSPAIEFDLTTPELQVTASGKAVVSRTIHPSGLRILTEEVPGALSASIGFWVAVGSRDEDSVSYGSTHFLEHLLFKGTSARSALDIAVAFDEVGGEHNALTAKEHTCYYAKVQDHDLGMAIDVLADMVADSTLDSREFELERQVILEELAMADDDPSDVAHERITELVLASHALGRPIGGNPATIAAATRESVWNHYQRHYRPYELVVTAAGGLKHADVVDRVLAALSSSGWDLTVSHEPAGRRLRGESPVVRPPASLVVRRPLEQAVVILAAPGLHANDERRHAMAVMSQVLGGGMSSRLFQEIREKRGLAYSVYSYASGYADAGLFGMGAGTSPHSVAEVANVMKGELHSLAESGITESELARTKGSVSGASALGLENSDARMIRLGRAELVSGEFVDRDEGLARLHAVDRDAVQSIAQELAARPLSAVVVGAVAEGIVDHFGPAAPAVGTEQAPAKEQ